MILEAKNLAKSFGSLRAVDDVSFAVAPGQTLAMVGESGCGKTTLAKIIAGLMRADSGRITARGKIQMVFQDPYNSLDPLYTVQGILGEAFYGRGDIAPARRQEGMQTMLGLVGLEAAMLGRFPHEFSGGQRQRIAIARALLAEPALLLLDEPTSALDVLVQKQILDLLAALKSRLGLTYVFISHNLRVVERFSDTIALMRDGKIVETGPTRDIFSRPQHPYTRQLLSAALHYTAD